MVASSNLSATTALPLDLDYLVKQSWAIAQVTVGNLQSFSTGTPGSSPIATRVTFLIQKVYKGQVSGSLDIDFLGGTIGTRRVSIPGRLGLNRDSDSSSFLRTRPTESISGTIGRDQGLLRIIFDPQTGMDRVYRWWGNEGVNPQTNFKDRTPLSMETTTGPAGNAETLPEFEHQLSQAIAQAQ